MLEPIKVLLVDDEDQFVEALAQRLEVRDFTVACASSGEQALEWLEENDTDVVVLDVLMPGKNGIETLREIKALKPLIEVILLTGHGTVDSAIEGMKQGAFDFLMKPTETDNLVEKLLKAQKRKADQEDRIRQAHIEHLMKTKSW